MLYATIYMDLKNFTLSERSKTQKTTVHDPMYVNVQNRQSMETEVSEGRSGAGRGEMSDYQSTKISFGGDEMF